MLNSAVLCVRDVKAGDTETEAILQVTAEKKLPMETCSSFASDCASVTIGMLLFLFCCYYKTVINGDCKCGNLFTITSKIMGQEEAAGHCSLAL